MDKRLKIASWVLVGALLLPLFQQITGLAFERKLRGAVQIAEMPSLSGEGWFEGTWQDSIETAMKDRFGFRNFFIRVNNQVAFSLYRKALANGVVIGKKNYLYESNYIHARNGTDYLGDSLILSNARKLKTLQDSLEARGTHFVVTFAAGKGSYYPEFFPDEFRMEPGKTNMQAYSDCFDSLGVNYVNFNDWFVSMKDTTSYNLYPRTGVHWSYYGMSIVFDSLVNYLEEVTGREMTDFQVGEVELSRHYRSSDKDIEQAMNILFRINYDLMAYPKISINDEGIRKPRGIVVADSFYWGLHNMGFSHRVLQDGEFWYYNKEIYSVNPGGVVPMEEVDPVARLDSAEVVMMMCTEATIMKFPFGFEEVLL